MPPSKALKSTPSESQDPSLSLQDAAYERIKHDIISLNFAPGAYLNELSLCKTLNLGRTPVHLALRRLMLEGFIEVVPRKGSMVKPLSLHEILDITEVRLTNEMHCARLAALRASAQDIADMTALLAHSELAGSTREVSEELALNGKFHALLSKAARNNVLAEILKTLYDRSLRFWYMSLREPQRNIHVCKEHMEILEAIKRRDPDAAAESVRRHIQSFRDTITKRIT